LSVFVLGLGAREREVDGWALVGDGRSTRSVVPSRFFGLFCLCASRTVIENRGRVSKLGHSFDVLVGVVQAVIAWVSQPLMPEQTFSLSFERRCWSAFLDALMEGHALTHGRQRLEGFSELGMLVFLAEMDSLNGGRSHAAAKSGSWATAHADDVAGAASGCDEGKSGETRGAVWHFPCRRTPCRTAS